MTGPQIHVRQLVPSIWFVLFGIVESSEGIFVDNIICYSRKSIIVVDLVQGIVLDIVAERIVR